MWKVGRILYDLASSVRVGIVLMVLLFIYMSIGSAGIIYPTHPNIFHPDAWAHAQMRQWRGLEMTEFEWFHWWPFTTLIALVSVTMIVTTIRRIPLRIVNLGVWLIHAGVIVLIIGSVWYFETKVEGDAPVARRKIVLALEGVEGTVELLAAVGASASIGSGPDALSVRVTEIDPAWELRSGPDSGTPAYSVSMAVNGRTRRFIRQLIANYPQYTEDLIMTDDAAQPMQRAIKATGSALVEPRLDARLEYESQKYFYVRNDLTKAWALYVRRKGESAWVERPMRGMPLYNDCVSAHADVFEAPLADGGQRDPLHPIDLKVPAVETNDPCADVTFSVSGYLRYAQTRSRLEDGGEHAPFNPSAAIEVTGGQGAQSVYRLLAFDPSRSSGDEGLIRMVSIDDESSFGPLQGSATLHIVIPAAGIDVVEPVRVAEGESQFVPVGGESSGYGFRVLAAQDELPVGSRTASVLVVDIKTPTTTIRRWVFDEPSLTRDVPAAEGGQGVPTEPDPSIRMDYQRGGGRAILTLVVGPEPNRLRLITSLGTGTTAAQVHPVVVDQPLALPAGLSLRVTSFIQNTVVSTRPMSVPQEQRVRDAREHFAQVLVNVPQAGSQWMEFSPYVVDDVRFALRRHPYHPIGVTLADGREIELLFSRQRLPLTAEVALEEFVLTSHEGGYTGEGGTIRDYTSLVRFRDGAGEAWGAPTAVSVNSPIEHNGLWYFQAQWDPPEPPTSAQDRGSLGLNYTVLGVGNRNGVATQLAGCIIAVLGMIYAFYAKPLIIRRRAERSRVAAEHRIANAKEQVIA